MDPSCNQKEVIDNPQLWLPSTRASFWGEIAAVENMRKHNIE